MPHRFEPSGCELYFGPAALVRPVASYKRFFSDEEWVHIDSLFHEDRRRERLYCRWWIKDRLVRAGYCRSHRSVRLDRRLQPLGRVLPVFITASHSLGWCSCIVAPKGCLGDRAKGIGCDIEEEARLRDHTRWPLHRDDRLIEGRCDALWTIKEACFKALPENKGVLLSDISIDMCAGSAVYENMRFKHRTFSCGPFLCSYALCF
jgi:phosphopantetheinyl transferase (holo-ACP synthase)